MDLISRFLQLSSLNKYVADSPEAQRSFNVEVESAIVDFGKEEESRLSSKMEETEVSLAGDETYRGGLTLVVGCLESRYFFLKVAQKTKHQKPGMQK